MMNKLEFLQSRHSVRAFDLDPVSPEALRKLASEIDFVNAHFPALHFQMFTGNDDPFRGFRRSYGFFRNARNYIACVADRSFSSFRCQAGYAAQQIVMKAVELGLGTCYVGGTYSAADVPAQLRPDWQILFLVVFGNPTPQATTAIGRLAAGFVHRKSRSWEDFYLDTGIPLKKALKDIPEVMPCLEAIACAPSAMNRQPVRLTVAPQSHEMHMSLASGAPETEVDLGIAQFNADFVLGYELFRPE